MKSGVNCWRETRADRAAFIIDGADYFSLLVESMEKAEKSIYICGWDIDSRISLRRDSREEIERTRLDRFLNHLCEEKPGLHIYVLIWDFAMIYALERETLPLFRLDLGTHARVHFVMDDQHPLTASHHQKIVVVDDKLAFCGGLDITKWRWDTSEHKDRDQRRTDPAGQRYKPFHDAQMAVDGPAAEHLADLFRRRWERATGQALNQPPPCESDPWPGSLKTSARNASVCIARTEPAYQGREEVREVQGSYLALISAARRSIYIENQYFTSTVVGEALADSLVQEEGPEIVLVLPERSVGWLEQNTMDARRRLVLHKLKRSDRHGRLAVYHPRVKGPEKRPLNVHAKVMVVDDAAARVGSANLSNRSMGLDTECDLILESRGDGDTADAVASLRERLLAEHLDLDVDRVRRATAEQGSLIEAIESLRADKGHMIPLEVVEPDGWQEVLAESAELADPERPLQAERLLERFLPEDVEPDEKKGYKKLVAVLVILIGLAAAWRWGPLTDWLDADALAAAASTLRDSYYAPLAVIAAFVLGGLLMIPLTFLVGVTAVVFSPPLAVFYSLVGGVASGLVTYCLGRKLGRETVRRFAGRRLNDISRKLAEKGVLTVAALRLIPMAPYTIINVVAGTSHLGLKEFLLGTALGLVPGTLAITIFADSLQAMIREPNWENILLWGGISVAAGLGLWGVVRWFKRYGLKSGAEKDD